MINFVGSQSQLATSIEFVIFNEKYYFHKYYNQLKCLINWAKWWPLTETQGGQFINILSKKGGNFGNHKGKWRKSMTEFALLWLIFLRFGISLLISLVGEIRGYFYTPNFSQSTIFVFQTLSRIVKKARFLHVFSAKRSHSRQTVVHHFTASRVGAGALWCEQQTKPNIRRSYHQFCLTQLSSAQ